MIEFGKTLREAREAKGLTIADIAAKTHMMSSMIGDLENEDFSRLPAPIYGRGFVKLYCEVVGIDAAPMIAEFMEIYNGNREPAIRERVVAPPPPAPAEPPAPPPVTAAEPPEAAQPDLFSAPAAESEPFPDALREPSPAEVAEPPPPDSSALSEKADEPVAAADIAEEPSAKRPHPFSHYATPLRERTYSIPRLTPAFGRWLVVASAAAIVIGGIAFGVRALYRATRTINANEPEVATAPAAEPAPTVPATDTKTSRTPIDVPPLYID